MILVINSWLGNVVLDSIIDVYWTFFIQLVIWLTLNDVHALMN